MARSETTAPELERQLKLRDKAIVELLERVDALEQRVGVRRSTSRSSTISDQSTVSRPTAPVGPTIERAPGTVVVSEADAERALERSLTLEGALLLKAGVMEIEPGITYARREDTTPGFTTIGSSVYASETTVSANLYTGNLSIRLGLPWGFQLETGQNYQVVKTEFVTRIDFTPTSSSKQTENSRGDLRYGIAKTLLTEAGSHPDLVGRVIWDSDSGEVNSYEEVQWSFTAIKREDPVTFLGSLAYQYTYEKNFIKPGAIVATTLGGLVALNPETSMRFMISGFYQQETKQAGVKLDASDRTIANFVAGGSTLLARGVLLNLSIGVGLTADADDFSIALSVPIRFN